MHHVLDDGDVNLTLLLYLSSCLHLAYDEAALTPDHVPCSVQVVLYVDGIRVGAVSATGDTPHHIIHRLCEIDMDMAANLQQPSQQQQGVGFTLKLPELQQGRHEVSYITPN